MLMVVFNAPARRYARGCLKYEMLIRVCCGRVWGWQRMQAGGGPSLCLLLLLSLRTFKAPEEMLMF
jgi:hypothetical protein